MSSKKKTAPHDDIPKPLKVGSRVRCTDDGVAGRLVWANALSVKIRWDDGEQVTWRRDSLADRPVEILDPPGDEPACLPDEPVQTPAPQPAAEVTPAKQLSAGQPGAETPAEQVLPDGEVPAEQRVEEAPAEHPGAETPGDGETTQPAAEQAEAAEPAQGKKKRQRKVATTTEGHQKKKLSALDAAAQVLAQASAPMNCQELIEAMTAQGLWSSPAGKTPSATLYSAILRETQTKGEHARFVKAERGKFALRDPGASQ